MGKSIINNLESEYHERLCRDMERFWRQSHNNLWSSQVSKWVDDAVNSMMVGNLHHHSSSAEEEPKKKELLTNIDEERYG